MSDYYENYNLNIPALNSKFLARDRSNFLRRGLQLIPGSTQEPSASFQNDEQTGFYNPSLGVVGFVSKGLSSFHFSSNSLTFIDKYGKKLNLNKANLSLDRTIILPNKDGTVALVEDRYIVRNNAEGSTIYSGQLVKITGPTEVALALSDTISNFAIGAVLTDTLAEDPTIIVYDGVFTLTDWTNVIGTTDLNTGSRYYLDDVNPGLLITTPPATPQLIGIAISTTELLLRLS